MRVVGGIAKGRKLASPVTDGVRPTSELIRGVIFNIVHPGEIGGATILDLYAGCGSLGIEGLSRGARFADFVEQDPKQCAVIRKNLASIGFDSRGRVHCMKVEKALNILKAPYNVVLMDPPYREITLGLILDRLENSQLLADQAIVVAGHSKRLVLNDNYGSLSRTVGRRHGDSAVDFFKMEVSTDGGCVSGHL